MHRYRRRILVPFPSRANVFRSLLYVDRCLLFRSCRPSSRVFLVPFGSVGRPCANACWCSVSLRARLACARQLRAVAGQLGLDTMHSMVVRCARVVGRFVHAPFRLGASDVRFGFVVRFFCFLASRGGPRAWRIHIGLRSHFAQGSRHFAQASFAQANYGIASTDGNGSPHLSDISAQFASTARGASIASTRCERHQRR